MRDLLRVNVRTLAEFYHEGGDLTRQGDAMERMREGTRGHQALQAAYADGWEKEVPLSLPVFCEGLTVRLYGRMDGLCLNASPPCLEEIKTTERAVQEIEPDDVPVHWAQAELYAAMLAENERLEAVQMRLTYLNLFGGKVSFTRTLTRECLIEKLQTYLTPYVRWLTAVLHWRDISRPTMTALSFPFDRYRAGQREMAANVYIALRDSRRLMCQAPTGIGKTMASLYPALKALGEDRIDRVFFLTARTTGQRAAEEALEKLRGRGLTARSVTLSARDKVCAQPDLPCDPDSCPRARGYFDRRRQALMEALSLQSLTPEQIRTLADRYMLCPFELSLDLSETADVIICDYNYVFDPRVRLQRFFTGKSDAGLLIDEAHNLCARAREMLSCPLSQRMFRDLRAHVGKASGRKHPVYRLLTPLLSAFRAVRDTFETESTLTDAPAGLIEAARDAMAQMGEHLHEHAAWHDELLDAFFALMDFVRCAEGYTEDYRTLLSADGKALCSVLLLCVNPAPHLSKTLRRVHGAALFSATLNPMSFYRDISGLSDQEEDALLDLPSPFPPENLLALRAPLPVRYRQRENSMQALTGLIAAFLKARIGNYMVFFPSYAYLRQTVERLAPALEEENVRLLIQDKDMDDCARAAFLGEFRPNPERTLAGFAVLGGAFAEGIDLAGNRLTGAIVVGTGVPQINASGDALKEVYEERFGSGYRYAYLYPGVAKVLQAAGRVIRSEQDRGAVLLIDQRWTDTEHRPLLPPHWQTVTIRSEADLTARLARFWDDST